jgi:hypothetical protein
MDSLGRGHRRGYHAEGKVNGQGVDVFPVLESNWRGGALEKLSTFKLLAPNWNSYGSLPPSEKAIKSAASFLMMMRDENLPRPRVIPIAGGGIQFEWNYGERELEIEFRPDGTLEYLWVPDRKSEGTEVLLPTISSREIESLMSWLTGG